MPGFSIDRHGCRRAPACASSDRRASAAAPRAPRPHRRGWPTDPPRDRCAT
jgi:hypothetical protein